MKALRRFGAAEGFPERCKAVRKLFSVSSLILGIIFFAVFMVAAVAVYYLTAGVFVTSRVAMLYTVLGLLGALAVVLRQYIFATLFYIGCALGWASGHYVSTLEGEFTATAGVITTFFLIGCFALVGLVLEVRRLRRRLRRKAEERRLERQAEKQRQAAVPAVESTDEPQSGQQESASAQEPSQSAVDDAARLP